MSNPEYYQPVDRHFRHIDPWQLNPIEIPRHLNKEQIQEIPAAFIISSNHPEMLSWRNNIRQQARKKGVIRVENYVEYYVFYHYSRFLSEAQIGGRGFLSLLACDQCVLGKYTGNYSMAEVTLAKLSGISVSNTLQTQKGQASPISPDIFNAIMTDRKTIAQHIQENSDHVHMLTGNKFDPGKAPKNLTTNTYGQIIHSFLDRRWELIPQFGMLDFLRAKLGHCLDIESHPGLGHQILTTSQLDTRPVQLTIDGVTQNVDCIWGDGQTFWFVEDKKVVSARYVGNNTDYTRVPVNNYINESFMVIN